MSNDKLEELSIVNAFDKYWNSAKYTNGWATPSISRNDIKPLLQLVARVLNTLCHHTCSIGMLESVSGAANDFFNNLTYHPLVDSKKFVLDLVTAVVHAAPEHFDNVSDDFIRDSVLSVLPKQDEHPISDIARCKRQVQEMMQSVNDTLPKLREHGSLSSWRSLVQAMSLAEQRLKILETEQEEAANSSSVPTLRLPPKSKKHKKKKRVNNDVDVQQPVAAASEASMPAEVPQDSQPSEPSNQIEATMASEGVQEASEPSQIVEIKKVSSFVEDIAPQLLSLKDKATKLDYDDLAKHPNVAYDYVSRLHRESVQYSEDLMKSLMKLDGLVCNMTEKPLRKSIVQKIQAMLDMMDEINNDLHDVQEKLNEKRMADKQAEEARLAQEAEAKRKEEEQRAAEEKRMAEEARLAEQRRLAEEQEAKRKAEEQRLLEEKKRIEEHQRRLAEQQRLVEQQLELARSPVQSVQDDEESDEDEEARIQFRNLNRVWSNIRWDPRTDVQELQDGYVIRVAAPNMKSDDFDIGMDGHVLNIRATKAPTVEDIKALREEARRLGVYEVGDQHVVQLAHGKFGRMSLQYGVPDDVDDSKISAKYDRGTLTLIMRKRPVIRRRPGYDWMW